MPGHHSDWQWCMLIWVPAAGMHFNIVTLWVSRCMVRFWNDLRCCNSRVTFNNSSVVKSDHLAVSWRHITMEAGAWHGCLYFVICLCIGEVQTWIQTWYTSIPVIPIMQSWWYGWCLKTEDWRLKTSSQDLRLAVPLPLQPSYTDGDSYHVYCGIAQFCSRVYITPFILFQIFALSAGMHACQVWGTAYLALDAAQFMSPMEKTRLVFTKRICACG